MAKDHSNNRRSSKQPRTPNIPGESSISARKTSRTTSQASTPKHLHHHNTRQTTTIMAAATVQDNSFHGFDVKKINDPEIAKLLMIQNQTITKLTQEMQELKTSNAQYLVKITTLEDKLSTLEQLSNTHTQSVDTINTLKDQVTQLNKNIIEERSRVDLQLTDVINNFQDHNDQQQLSDAVIVNSKHLPPTVTQETCMEAALQLFKDHLSINIRSDELKDCKLMGYQAEKLSSRLNAVLQEKTDAEDLRQKLFNKARNLHEQIMRVREKRRQEWWTAWIDARRIGTQLEERQAGLRNELDSLHRRIIGSIIKREPLITGVKDEPSRRANYKISVIRLRHEIEDLRRRVEAMEIKVEAEMKLRTLAQREVKTLRSEVGRKKANVALTQRVTLLRNSASLPPDLLLRI